MSIFRKVAAIGSLVILGACYHATIETGLSPSPQVIDNQWASSWVFGLVPPKTVETMAKCPDGVSKVETQLSFLNGLVGVLTFSIYTPMSIKVTCAASGHAAIPAGAPTIQLGEHPTAAAVQDALARAAAQSVAAGTPVYLEF
jgi:Bor protein